MKSRKSQQGRKTRDAVARLAAELLLTKRAGDVSEAIARAAGELELRGTGQLPSAALVRKHAQGMAQEAMGDAAYRAANQARLNLAVQVMEALELEFGTGCTLLVGRAAKGQLDADPQLHIRVYTRGAVTKLARVVAEAIKGAIQQTVQHADQEADAATDEPEFATVDTKHGRANQVIFAADLDGVACEVKVLRCLPEWKSQASHDLFTGKPVKVKTLEQM